MMNKGNIPRAIRYTLFGEVSKTATKLDTLVVLDLNGVKKIRVKHYANVIPN